MPDSRNIGAFTPARRTDRQRSGSISGTVVDQSGASITGALVKLVREGESSGTEALSDENGQFFFSNVAPGPFDLTISSADLAPQSILYALANSVIGKGDNKHWQLPRR